MAEREKPSICFVAHNALSALMGDARQHAGGIERQQAMMSRWLVSAGFRTSMITWAERGTTDSVIHEVRHFPLCSRDAGLPGLRFFYPRWSSLMQAMRRADSDIYYYNLGDMGLGQVGLWTRHHGRQLVYSVASDVACDSSLPALRSLRERVLYQAGLARTDAFIVQNDRQKSLLRENFSIAARKLPMPSEGYAAVRERKERAAEPALVIWVGRLSAEKRPHWLIEIARALPEVEFEIIGAANLDSEYANSVQEQAEQTPNVTLRGRVSHEQMGEYYRRATLLCSTSEYEGFPNIFLEAWSAGVPTVATCDPDNLIERERLGKAAETLPGLIDAIRQCLDSQVEFDAMCTRATNYFDAHHSVDLAMQGFADLFCAVYSDRRRR